MKSKLHGNARDLSNQRFNRLIAVRPTKKRSGNSVVWKCLCDCGKIVFVGAGSLTTGHTKSCGCLNTERRREAARALAKRAVGENNTNWKGGRRTYHGYIYIKKRDHPYAKHGGYVAEHRLIMEGILGRYLKPEEVVHHEDGNLANNKPSNLKLFKNAAAHQRYHGKKRGGINPARAVYERSKA